MISKIIKKLIFVLLIGIVIAGEHEKQTNVPDDHDCSCIGYEAKALECNWPVQKCDSNSTTYQNFVYWCKILNNFRQDKREGNTAATYNRSLTCRANLNVTERNKIEFGLIMEDPHAKPTPGSLPVMIMNYPKNASLPTSVNWTSSMTPIKNQGNCGSCWVFSSIAICEWWYKNVSPSPVILSEQGLVSCGSKAGGCNGGWPTNALNYLAASGTANSTYLYTAKNSVCNISSYETYKCPSAAYEWYVPAGNCTRLRQLLAQGPVASTIFVTAGFSQYKSGLYSDSLCPSNGTVNHGIDIVGYVTEPTTGKNAFVLRNSWGTGWGMKGYMYIDASVNTCGICNFFWYY